jgi:hypothetical protein
MCPNCNATKLHTYKDQHIDHIQWHVVFLKTVVTCKLYSIFKDKLRTLCLSTITGINECTDKALSIPNPQAECCCYSMYRPHSQSECGSKEKSLALVGIKV